MNKHLTQEVAVIIRGQLGDKCMGNIKIIPGVGSLICTIKTTSPPTLTYIFLDSTGCEYSGQMFDISKLDDRCHIDIKDEEMTPISSMIKEYRLFGLISQFVPTFSNK